MNGWMVLAGIMGAWIGMWLWRRWRRQGRTSASAGKRSGKRVRGKRKLHRYSNKK
ncbi:MAG: hypothetical protein Kow002_13890 [Anaerolineales bacterium]